MERGFRPAVRCLFFANMTPERASLPAGCGFLLFSPKIQMKSRQLPAGRGLLQTFFCFCNAEKGNLATGGAEDFSFHSLHHRVLKFAKRDRQLFSGFIYLLRVTLRFCQMNQQKKQQIFFRHYCFHWPPVAAGIQFWGLSVKAKLE